MEQTLNGCRIIVTRPEEQAEELATALRARGALVRVRPLVRVSASPEPEPLRDALTRLSEYDWVVFTSVNAVRAAVTAAPGDTGWPAVACVGPATAEAAAREGLGVSLVPREFTGEALARELAARGVQGARVLWPRADRARDVLSDVLRTAGAEVDAPIAYCTQADPEAARTLAAELAAAPADVALFLSPSAVRTMKDAGGLPHGVAAAVIGTVTGQAANDAGMQVVVRPDEHTAGALLSALEAWWERAQTGERGPGR